MAMIFGLILAAVLMLYQAYEIPAEPVILVTTVSSSGLTLEPTDPKPIVGVLLVICRNRVFMCSDNGGEFKVCAKWELADLGLRNPRFINGKCVADRK